MFTQTVGSKRKTILTSFRTVLSSVYHDHPVRASAVYLWLLSVSSSLLPPQNDCYPHLYVALVHLANIQSVVKKTSKSGLIW